MEYLNNMNRANQTYRSSSWLLVILSLFFSTSVMASKPQIARNHWIVELDDAPTLEYRGAQAALSSISSNDARPARATAPAVTGPGQFDAQASHVLAYTQFLDSERARVLDNARARLNRDLEPTAVFRHTLNGFSARMTSAEARELARTPGVRSVQPVLIHQLQLLHGPQLIGARDLASGLPGLSAATGAGTVVGVIDSGINADHLAFSDNPSIGGFSFTNPYGSGQGLCGNPDVNCNNKLVGVFDFTTEGTLGLDNDGHGTHVAATAAGVEWSDGLAGVAPAANIVSWKACYLELPDEYEDRAGEPGCISPAFLQAFESAIELGVDVVNFSIGGESDISPWANHYGRQVLNLWQAGIPFVTSAGNNGPGPGTVTFPAYVPWAFAVGSSTHRQRRGQRILISGVGAWFITYGSGPGLPTTPITGVPLVPGDEAGNSLLGCDSFSANAFADSVALLKRGDCTFEVKVNNAAAAGALAVVMINNVPGDPIDMGGLENTTIPAGMIRLADGDDILAAINEAAEPLLVNMPSAVVTSSSVDFQDQISAFSSRGPSGVQNLVKPNVTAPGQGILAAHIGGSTAGATRSGTSMASPHVTGAIAQLRQLFPDWGPDALQSSLETTAETDPMIWANEPATLFDRGSGRIRVDLAARAGLYLPVSRAQFTVANPAEGGSPGNLNLAGIMVDECDGTCTVVRTVEALTDGSWSAHGQGDLAISVSPASFSLAAGERQVLTISIAAGSVAEETLGQGQVVLTPDDADMSVQRLQVGAFVTPGSLPERTEITASSNRGGQVLELDSVPALPEAVFNTSALIRPSRETFSLAQDPTPDDPFSGGAGTRTFLVDVPEDALMLFVETASEQAPDIDLFVGFDANGNGQPEEAELVCVSWEFMESTETCAISNPQSGTWWIVVQNWLASSDSGSDAVSLEHAVLENDSAGYSLVASGVGIHSGGPLDLQLYWDQPEMRQNERWIGAVGVSTTPDSLADVGAIAVLIERDQPNQPQATALFKGESLAVVVPPNTRHDKLFIDVPPSTFQLGATIQGDDGIIAGLQPTVFGSLTGSAPGTPEPPPGMVVSGTGSAEGIELVTGNVVNPIVPARWYVILENPTNEEKLVYVEASYPEPVRLNSRYGLWSPQSRLIFQGIEWQRAGPGFMIWYSYDHEGLPIFYIATADIDPQSSAWKATLERVTGNNERQKVEVVGEVVLTTLGSNVMSFAWRLNGAHGSELMTPDAPQTCPEVDGEPFSLTGHWFSPGNVVGGTTMILTRDNQSYVRYYYDDDGVGRWVFVSAVDDDLGAAGEVRDFRGFCPNCESFPMSYDGNSTAVGAYGVSFDSESTGTEVIDFTSAPPLNHDISLDVPIQKLSERLSCAL